MPNFPIDRTRLKESMKDNLQINLWKINNNAFDYGFNIVNSKVILTVHKNKIHVVAIFN